MNTHTYKYKETETGPIGLRCDCGDFVRLPATLGTASVASDSPNQSNETHEANGAISREFIQCANSKGRIGCFLATNSRREVSPTFGNLADLYTWARRNNWRSESGAYVYRAT